MENAVASDRIDVLLILGDGIARVLCWSAIDFVLEEFYETIGQAS